MYWGMHLFMIIPDYSKVFSHLQFTCSTICFSSFSKFSLFSQFLPNCLTLVGGLPTPLKNMKVSWDDYSQLNGSHEIPWFQTTTNQ